MQLIKYSEFVYFVLMKNKFGEFIKYQEKKGAKNFNYNVIFCFALNFSIKKAFFIGV